MHSDASETRSAIRRRIMPGLLAAMLLLGACAATGTAPGTAQGAMSPAAMARAQRVIGPFDLPPQPLLGRLDGALIQGADFRPALDEVTTTLLKLNWLASRHYGGWVQASGRYASDVFATGTAERNEALRENGVLVWLYLMALARTDLKKCGDRSAGGYLTRLGQPPFDEIVAHARTLPRPTLERLASAAIRWEASIAPDRVDRSFVCTFTVARSSGDTSPPPLRPRAEWEEQAAVARADLPRQMAGVIDVLLEAEPGRK